MQIAKIERQLLANRQWRLVLAQGCWITQPVNVWLIVRAPTHSVEVQANAFSDHTGTRPSRRERRHGCAA